MRAVIRGVSRDVRDANGLPKGNLAPPVLVGAHPRRHPNLEPHTRWVSARFLDQLAELLECGERSVAGRKDQRHETVAIFRRAAKRCLSMAAEPDRHSSRQRARVDANLL